MATCNEANSTNSDNSWWGNSIGGLINTAKSFLGFSVTTTSSSSTEGLSQGEPSSFTAAQERDVTSLEGPDMFEKASKQARKILDNLIIPAIEVCEKGKGAVSLEIRKLADQCQREPALLAMLKVGKNLLENKEYQAAPLLEYLYMDDNRWLKTCFREPFEDIKGFGYISTQPNDNPLFCSIDAIRPYFASKIEAGDTDLPTFFREVSKEMETTKLLMESAKELSPNQKVSDQFYDGMKALLRCCQGAQVESVQAIYGKSVFLQEILSQSFQEWITAPGPEDGNNLATRPAALKKNSFVYVQTPMPEGTPENAQTIWKRLVTGDNSTLSHLLYTLASTEEYEFFSPYCCELSEMASEGCWDAFPDALDRLLTDTRQLYAQCLRTTKAENICDTIKKSRTSFLRQLAKLKMAGVHYQALKHTPIRPALLHATGAGGAYPHTRYIRDPELFNDSRHYLVIPLDEFPASATIADLHLKTNFSFHQRLRLNADPFHEHSSDLGKNAELPLDTLLVDLPMAFSITVQGNTMIRDCENGYTLLQVLSPLFSVHGKTPLQYLDERCETFCKAVCHGKDMKGEYQALKQELDELQQKVSTDNRTLKQKINHRYLEPYVNTTKIYLTFLQGMVEHYGNRLEC